MLADVSYTPTPPHAGVLFVRGSIGLANARDVCVVMLSLIDNSELTRLTVDLSEAEFIGAAGALALLAGRRYGASSCAVELRNPSPTVHRFIDILAPDVLDALPAASIDLASQPQSHYDRSEHGLAMFARLANEMRAETR